MIPLDHISDYVDINAVVNPWQALVVVVLIFALLIWPSMSARQSAKRVEKTLTEKNGGSSVKDQNDRIETTLANVVAKLDGHSERSESYVRRTTERLDALESKRAGWWPWRR